MKLDLYMFETCPYCRRVMKFIQENDIQGITYHDIHKSQEDRQTLIQVGGMEQVPCLFIDGKPLYESLDIIDWLKENQK